MFFIADHSWLQLVKSVLICCVCLRCLCVASYKAITQESVAVWAPLLGVEFWAADRAVSNGLHCRRCHPSDPQLAAKRSVYLSWLSRWLTNKVIILHSSSSKVVKRVWMLALTLASPSACPMILHSKGRITYRPSFSEILGALFLLHLRKRAHTLSMKCHMLTRLTLIHGHGS